MLQWFEAMVAQGCRFGFCEHTFEDGEVCGGPVLMADDEVICYECYDAEGKVTETNDYRQWREAMDDGYFFDFCYQCDGPMLNTEDTARCYRCGLESSIGDGPNRWVHSPSHGWIVVNSIGEWV